LDQFSPRELELCAQIIERTTGLDRSWEYWTVRLDRAMAKPGGKPQPVVRRRAAKTAKRVKGSKHRVRSSR
jgi:hypothetical protein